MFVMPNHCCHAVPGCHPGLDPGSMPRRPWIAGQARNDRALLSCRTRSGIQWHADPGLRIRSAMTEHCCHAELDPGSMPRRPWIAGQARHDRALLSCRTRSGIQWHADPGLRVKPAMTERCCQAGLDPGSMPRRPWIAGQARNDRALLSCRTRSGIQWHADPGLRIRSAMTEHCCHAELDPGSMPRRPWIAGQARHDRALLSCRTRSGIHATQTLDCGSGPQ